MTDLPAEAIRVVDFWFREIDPGQWFRDGATLDPIITERFGTLIAQARAGGFDSWALTPRGCLALVLLLDQLPRHVFRDEAEAFASDEKAQALVLAAIEAGLDEKLNIAERHFLYMPLMHAESEELQAISVRQFERLREFTESLIGFAEGHRQTIETFGRFPARNEALGRASTDAEIAFLAQDH